MTEYLTYLQGQWAPVWFKLPFLLKGLYYTAVVSVTSYVASTAFGLLVAVARRSENRLLSALGFLYTQIFRSMSLYVYILFLYFGIAAFLRLTITPLNAAILSVTLMNSANVAEIFRASLDSIDHGQGEASDALGLSRWTSFFDIILPQAFRISIPALGVQLINIVKDSSIVGVIGVADMMYEAQRAASVTYRQFEFLTTTAVIYVLIVFALSHLSGLVERRFAKAL